jgi:integrase
MWDWGRPMVGKGRGRHPEKALTALTVRSQKKPGRYADGGGLHLLVKPNGAKSWVLRLVANGRRRDFGLGSAHSVSLADARDLAAQYRKLVKAGVDPAAEKRRAARAVPTFEESALLVHTQHSPSWRNEKHGAQWINTLRDYAFPVIGKRRIDQIEVADVLKVLGPIWLTKPETARRVRQRIRTVLDWARAAGYRDTENPVGPVLAKALPRQSDRAGHHSALPYSDVPGFVERLREYEGAGEVAKLAFEFLILTATRTGEVLGARWPEIDLEAKVWTVPPERMKAAREFRVPLPARAVEILNRAQEFSGDSELVFQGARIGRPLSNMVFLMLLRRMGVEATAHGFRSAFSDWVSEATGFPAEVREMALAHSIADKTEAAYRRGDLFEKRRQLMDAWAGYLAGASGKVVPLQKAAHP